MLFPANVSSPTCKHSVICLSVLYDQARRACLGNSENWNINTLWWGSTRQWPKSYDPSRAVRRLLHEQPHIGWTKDKSVFYNDDILDREALNSTVEVICSRWSEDGDRSVIAIHRLWGLWEIYLFLSGIWPKSQRTSVWWKAVSQFAVNYVKTFAQIRILWGIRREFITVKFILERAFNEGSFSL